MKQESNVLNPVVTVKICGDENVEVKELTWKDYIRAVKDMTGSLLKILGENGTVDGMVILNREKLLDAITSQENLMQWVIEKSTGKDSKWVNELCARDALNILAAIVDLNLTEEIVGSGKALAGRMGEVFGLKKASPEPATTSSRPATASPTSK